MAGETSVISESMKAEFMQGLSDLRSSLANFTSKVTATNTAGLALGPERSLCDARQQLCVI